MELSHHRKKPHNRDTAIQQQVRVTSMRTCDQEGAFQTQEPLVQENAELRVLVVTDGASALTPNDTVLDMQDLEESQSLFTQEIVNGTDVTRRYHLTLSRITIRSIIPILKSMMSRKYMPKQ